MNPPDGPPEGRHSPERQSSFAYFHTAYHAVKTAPGAILSPALIASRLQGVSVAEKWDYSAIALVLGSLLTMGAVYAWYRLTCGFLRGVKSGYDFHVKQTQATSLAKEV